MEVRAISEAIMSLRDVQAIVVADSLSTLEEVRQGMHYADLKQAIT